MRSRSIGRLVSISVGMPAAHMIDGRLVTTGVFKQPATGPVHIGPLGAAGDGQATQPNHGGPDQALSAYSTAHYRFWGARFGRNDFSPGIFGENLTTEGMTEEEVYIGDVLAIGTAVLQVTHPRIPCFRLSHRLGLPLFHDEQLQSGRVGFLLRVLEDGELEGGAPIILVERDRDPVSVAQCIAATLHGQELPDVLRRLSELPHLSPKWRKLVSSRLESNGAAASA
jgi:MOSC domain-containing protein YiiM